MSENLKEMAAADALLTALAMSTADRDHVAAAIGIAPGTLDSWASARDPHWPSLLNIPRLCAAMGNDFLLQWLQAQVDGFALEYRVDPITPQDLCLEVVKLGAAFGELARTAETAIKDQRIDKTEAMRLRGNVRKLIRRSHVITTGLRPIG